MSDSGLFKLFADEGYKFGSCSARVYDRNLNPDDFLLQLYRASKPRLASTFCGMTDLSAAAITAYLSTRNPLLLMCVDNDELTGGFEVVGYAFPTIVSGPKQGAMNPDPGRTALVGYAFFRSWWGKPEITVCMMLMGVYFFHEFNLLTLQGQSLPGNQSTRRFLRQFGTKDVGIIPKFLLYNGTMVDSIQTCLYREDFEACVRRTLVECSDPPSPIAL